MFAKSDCRGSVSGQEAKLKKIYNKALLSCIYHSVYPGRSSGLHPSLSKELHSELSVSSAEELTVGDRSEVGRMRRQRMGLEAGKEIRSRWEFPREVKL